MKEDEEERDLELWEKQSESSETLEQERRLFDSMCVTFFSLLHSLRWERESS